MCDSHVGHMRVPVLQPLHLHTMVSCVAINAHTGDILVTEGGMVKSKSNEITNRRGLWKKADVQERPTEADRSGTGGVVLDGIFTEKASAAEKTLLITLKASRSRPTIPHGPESSSADPWRRSLFEDS